MTKLPSSVEEMFALLFSTRPAAKIGSPIEAVPSDVTIAASSSDPEAWRAWATERAFVKAMMETPLFEELRMSRVYLDLDGLQHQVAQAATIAGNERKALWQGPTAIGLDLSEGDAPPSVVIVKAIDRGLGAAVRFGAAFALLGQETGAAASKPAGGVKLYTLSVRERTIAFAVFSNLLIAGNDADLVERSALLAQKDEQRGLPVTGEDDLPFPDPKTPGVHVRVRALEGSSAPIFGLDAIGLSLVMDEAAPVIVRRRSGGEGGAGELLRYAPEGCWLAVASGLAPSAAMLETIRSRLGVERLEIGAVDAGAIAGLLKPGVALILGATRDRAESTPAGVVVFRHENRQAELEPKARELLEAMTARKVSRTVLEAFGGALLLDAGGPSIALTGDALLAGLDPDRLRLAVAAGAGKAPSLGDRKGVEITASDAAFVDLDAASTFLDAFYGEALAKDAETPWSDAKDVLGPTFEALGSGGALFAKMAVKDRASEGAFHALP